MAEPFVGEIRMMSFNQAPTGDGWAMCNGQLLPINQNQALFSLLGTTFGGDGRVTFALPDLRGQTPIHVGQGHVLGEKGGQQATTLSISQMPLHTHIANASQTVGNANSPTPSLMLATSTPQSMYGPATNFVAMLPATVTNTGGSQAHLNMQPFLVVTFAIALTGIFPSPN
jgi:microcystin-dependent protein